MRETCKSATRRAGTLYSSPAISLAMESTSASETIDRLDLVITVDTPVAHLAGAIGKPVWILLST
ncbi:hypothetical protein KTD17_26870 [Burkholderia multivorans]|nr:hypothetical protein [Burkholderia multivorans]